MEPIQSHFAIGIHSTLRTHTPIKKSAPKKPVLTDGLRNPIYSILPHPWLLTSPKNNNAHNVIAQAINPLTKTLYTGVVPILNFLVKELRRQKMLYPSRIRFHGTQPEIIANIYDAIKHVKKNQRRIRAFRSLLRCWLLKCRFKSGNEEDLLTGEVPKNPITLNIWSERRTYNFEPNTIRRDMLERLLKHSYLFPTPLKPRNPYTNCHMTHNEFMSVMRQLRLTGQTHWALEGLMTCKYDMEVFKVMFVDPIKREIIAKQFNNITSPETIELVLEFIEDEHAENFKYFHIELYRWAVENISNDRTIKKWIRLCRRRNECTVNMHDMVKVGTELLEIHKLCKVDCEFPFELEDMCNNLREKKGLPRFKSVNPVAESVESAVEDAEDAAGDVLDIAVIPVPSIEIYVHTGRIAESEFDIYSNEIENLLREMTVLYPFMDEVTISGSNETPSSETDSL